MSRLTNWNERRETHSKPVVGQRGKPSRYRPQSNVDSSMPVQRTTGTLQELVVLRVLNPKGMLV